MSSNGRTLVSGTSNWGSSPCIRTMNMSIKNTIGIIGIMLLAIGVFWVYSYTQNTPHLSIQESYEIIQVYPHSTQSYTQGLFFDGDILYESTGSPEYIPQTRSILGPLDLNTGEIDIKAELDKTIYFGEGSTILDDKIYQLTYKNQKGFVYDSKTFDLIQEFDFVSQEGWGLTNDGEFLIMSDGTDKITYLDSDNFEVIRQIPITYNQRPQYHINELEYVNGFIYANIYQTNSIVKIQPENGEIVDVIDMSDIVQQVKQVFPYIAELNGIAYRESTQTFFVTGKLWPYIYEIRI